MKTQHTLGKWKLRESELDIKGGTWVVEQDNGDRRGLYIGTVDRTIPAGEANARLIAAAPDLLEALKLLLDYVRENTNDAKATIPRGVARAAIALTEGNK